MGGLLVGFWLMLFAMAAVVLVDAYGLFAVGAWGTGAAFVALLIAKTMEGLKSGEGTGS